MIERHSVKMATGVKVKGEERVEYAKVGKKVSST
jgi:hypothetical protein